MTNQENGVKKDVNKIDNSERLYRYSLLFIGCLIAAVAFNLFFLRYKIVCFGISGVSIVLSEYGVNASTFMLVTSMLLLGVSFIFLGKEKTKNSIVGSILYPILVIITEPIVKLIEFQNLDLIIIAIFGGVITGIGYGLIYKAGFTTGGTDIINQIIAKYFKTSMGNAILITDGLVTLSGKLVFSWEIVLYGFIILYIVSTISDKVIIGISQSKTFHIVTEHDEEVIAFLHTIINGGVTIIPVIGGYSNEKKKMLMCVAPTKEYYVIKEAIKKIDNDAFFLVTDSYEVSK